MNVKRICASAITATTLIATLGTIAVSAYVVVTDNPHRKEDNVKTYSVKYVDDYANHYAYPQYTAVSASDASYYGSYKWVQYIQYAQSSCYGFYRIKTIENDGTTQSVLTESETVTDSVARRAHITQLYYTSDTNSSIIETFRAYITKPGLDDDNTCAIGYSSGCATTYEEG